MNGKNREIERKFRVKGWEIAALYTNLLERAFIKLKSALPECTTRDYYFPKPSGLQMVRLRDSYGTDDSGFSKQLQELTVKQKDQGTNFNRLEINNPLENCKSMYDTLSLLFGAPYLTLHKKECVIFTDDAMVISLAHVEFETDVFLEVEGPSEDLVNDYVRRLELWYEMTPESRSLVEIFGGGN